MEMRNFIQRKMNEIFDDFMKEIEEKDRLCELKELRFDGDNPPDYSNPSIQRLYLLRYLPAYLTEYYLIYTSIIDSNFLGSEFKVLSIGAGCGLDYWALNFAIMHSGGNIRVRYTGIDVIDWGHKENLEIGEAEFIINNIAGFSSLPHNDYNIIIFPKSIGEFDNKTFLKLLNLFRNARLNTTKLVLISSARKTRRILDLNRIESVKREIAISSSLFANETIDYNPDFGNYPYPPRLETICPYFYYPDDIREYIVNLSCNCSQYNIKGSYCDRTCMDLDRNPILTAFQITYQIYYLEDVFNF